MKYSIVIVTRNSAGFLPACLESIVKYSPRSDYEVIIVDNASTDGSVSIFNTLEGDVAIIMNEFNSGFARASNQGIRAARGDYIVLLNPDTSVTPDWLEKMSGHFKRPEVGAVGPLSNFVAGLQKFNLYLTDGSALTAEKINEALTRDYSGKSVESSLLIGFCLMIPRRVIDEIGTLDDDLILGNEDLEYSERLRENGFELLITLDTFIYHEGQHSFSQGSDAERWVNFSARMLEGKLRRKMQTVDPRKIWGMDWFQPKPNLHRDQVSIVIPTFNGLNFTNFCLESIRRSTIHPYEIIVVDNGSSDGTVEFLRKQENIILIENGENRGYPTACNQGLEKSSAPYVLLLNNDVVVTEGWLGRMFQGFFNDPEVGLIGPRSNDSAGFQWVSNPDYRSLDELEGYAQRLKKSAARQFRQVDFLSGFSLLIDRRVIERIGLLDERFGVGNYEDQDFCRRAQNAGFKMLVANEVFIHHFGSQSFVENDIPYKQILEENRRKYELKWSEATV